MTLCNEFDACTAMAACSSLWIYYTAQIFLLGAEFTRAYAHHCRCGRRLVVSGTSDAFHRLTKPNDYIDVPETSISAMGG